MSNECRLSRVEFLKSVGRFLAVGTLIAGAAKLVNRPARRNDRCVSDGICSRCGAITDCGLPQALSAKQAIAVNNFER